MDIKVLKEKRKGIIIVKYNIKLVGHLEIAKTIELITRDFMWPRLRKDVEIYI